MGTTGMPAARASGPAYLPETKRNAPRIPRARCACLQRRLLRLVVNHATSQVCSTLPKFGVVSQGLSVPRPLRHAGYGARVADGSSSGTLPRPSAMREGRAAESGTMPATLAQIPRPNKEEAPTGGTGLLRFLLGGTVMGRENPSHNWNSTFECCRLGILPQGGRAGLAGSVAFG
jgi:hypothetical protein